MSFGVGCAKPGYPGAYTRSSCFLGFVAEQFGLKAEFSPAGERPDWSTDCPAGASRRRTSPTRAQQTTNRNRKNKNKKNKNKKNKKNNQENGKKSVLQKVNIRNSSNTSRDRIITIDDLVDDSE